MNEKSSGLRLVGMYDLEFEKEIVQKFKKWDLNTIFTKRDTSILEGSPVSLFTDKGAAGY